MVSTLLAGLFTAFTLLSTISAIPTAEVTYPEVIPGPGLPSLASLGLTSEQLYTMPLDEKARRFITRMSLDPRFDTECGPDDGAYTNVNEIIACFNYLNSIGGNSCGTCSQDNEFCYSGNSKITGSPYGDIGCVSSSCADVATGAINVVNACTRPDQSVAGFAAAYGNGNLIVGCTNINY